VPNALLLVNPKSRSGNSDLNDALQQLREAGYTFTELKPESRADVSKQIIAHADKADLLIIGGGDGTINAAIRGVYESGITAAVLPLGTANDFARSLKIPFALPDAVKTIIKHRCERVDIGQLNQQYFVNVAHIGLAVDVARSSNDTEKKYLSVFAYLLAMFRALKRNRSFRATIEYGETTLTTRCNHISVGSGRNYGGGMVVAENAKINDGLLELFTWKRRSLLRLIWAAIGMRHGRHTHLKEVRQITAPEITISTDQLLQVAADGEVLDKTPVEFSVHPLAVNVIVGEEFEHGD